MKTINIFSIVILLIIVFSCNKKHKPNLIGLQNLSIQTKQQGQAKPTIIFENGMASTFKTWTTIPDSISKQNKVFLYNRAGLGESSLSSKERTIPNMIKELNEVLKKEKIEPPYIYVAHSMGSYLARYYASKFPNEIKGILLIDPSPNKMYDEYTEKQYKEFKKIGDDSFSNSTEGEKLEWKNYLNNRKYLANSKISDQIPMIIISATQWDFSKYHKDMMNNNKFSKHIIEKGSHNIHEEKPELIIKYIRELIQNSQ